MNNTQNQEETIDIKVLMIKFFRYWHLFVLTIIIALIVAFLFNKYTLPKYEVSTTVLINQDKGSNIDPQDLLGFGMLSGKQNLENEVGIMRSNSLAYRTIQKLDLFVSYFNRKNFITRELYQNSPIQVDYDKTHPQIIGVKFYINIINGKEYKLEFEGEEKSTYDFNNHKFIQKHSEIKYSKTHRFGELITHPLFKLKIIINPDYISSLEEYNDLYFVFNDLKSLVKQFKFNVEPINREATIALLTLKGSNINKSVNFLNQLTAEYLARGLDKKNEVAINTIDFITRELQGISDSLLITENNLQNYRSNNQIMDVDFQAKQGFEYMKELESEKAVLLVKSKYYKKLKEYLNQRNSIDDIVAPSSIGIEDPLLNNLVGELTQLFNSRSELLFSSTEKNPMVLSIDEQIKNTKGALIENINNIINTSDIAINDINERIDDLNKRIDYLPKTQRQLISIERKFKLNDAMYTFLLQKLQEAQITKASNSPDNEVLDYADTDLYKKVYPKSILNYIIAILLGSLLPIIYILGKDFLNNKITSQKDIENITQLPIVGEILHNNKGNELAVISSPKSSIAESFRNLRTNIQYLTEGKENQTIMVTSDVASSGKTFVSINLASTLAQFEKKTLLIGFDLRKPKIYQDFNLSNTIGLSTYYINKNSIDEAIQQTNIHNLDILLAGPIPPNPSELIASNKTKLLFDSLKEKYNYIIIDTPPIGFISDAALLMKHSDVNLFVVRQNFTYKKVFESIIKNIEQKKYPNFSIVVNDLKIEKKSYGYGYEYAYGYGYGHGYYSDDNN